MNILIANGLEINTKIWEGDTILHIAVRYFSSFYGRIFKYFISKGANVNAKNDTGYTPLHVAAEKNKHWAAKILLGGGADVNTKSNSNSTPFSIAIANGK